MKGIMRNKIRTLEVDEIEEFTPQTGEDFANFWGKVRGYTSTAKKDLSRQLTTKRIKNTDRVLVIRHA